MSMESLNRYDVNSQVNSRIYLPASNTGNLEIFPTMFNLYVRKETEIPAILLLVVASSDLMFKQQATVMKLPYLTECI